LFLRKEVIIVPDEELKGRPCPDCGGNPGDTDDGDSCSTCGGDGWVE